MAVAVADAGNLVAGVKPMIDGTGGASRTGEILRESAKLFAANGFGGTSMQDIASAVGIRKASLYHFFPDKAEIHSTIVILSLTRLTALVQDRQRGLTRSSDRVEAFARAHAQHIAESAPFYFTAALGYNQIADPAVKAKVQRMRDGYEETLRGIIRQGIETGEFRELDVKLAARAIISCLNWMARWWRPDGPDSAETIASDYVKLILRGFLPEPDR
jgi:AcrR family transcriptional regulator